MHSLLAVSTGSATDRVRVLGTRCGVGQRTALRSWLSHISWLGSDPDQKFNQDDLHRLLMCNEVAAAVCGGHAVASDPFCAPFDLSPAIWASGSRRCHLRQDGCTATTIVAIQRIRNDYGLIESESRYRTTSILIKNLGMGADPDTRQTRRTPLDRHPGASQV